MEPGLATHQNPLTGQVAAGAQLSREIWQLFREGRDVSDAGVVLVSASAVAQWEHKTELGIHRAAWASAKPLLRELELWRTEVDAAVGIHASLARPQVLVSILRLTGQLPTNRTSGYKAQEHINRSTVAGEHSYLVWRAIRGHWEKEWKTVVGESSRTMTESLHDTVRALRQFMLARTSTTKASPTHITNRQSIFELVDSLASQLCIERTVERTSAVREVEFLLECGRALDTAIHPYLPPWLWVQPEWQDADRILSHLYGLRTNMPFFDELFEGGGVQIAESMGGKSPRGRVIVVRGRFGTGKTSLALALSAAVGRAGGRAWVIPLEQSAEYCLEHMLAFGLVTSGPRDSIEANSAHSQNFRPTSDGRCEEHCGCDQDKETGYEQGYITMWRSRGQPLQQLLEEIRDEADACKSHLRLVVLDPLNSIRLDRYHGEQLPAIVDDSDKASATAMPQSDYPQELDKSAIARRITIVDEIDELCKRGTNLVVTAEHGDNGPRITDDLANIADTVIDLSIRPSYGYQQRYIEVMKSRLQREQRGPHPMAIQPGAGISVALSAPSVMARMRARGTQTARFACQFGWKPMDDLLGPNAFYQGDVLALVGHEGSFKTLLGLSFLLGTDWSPVSGESMSPRPISGLTPKSLLIAVRDQPAVHRLLESPTLASMAKKRSNRRNDDESDLLKTASDIEILEVPSGMVTTAWILRLLKEKFDDAKSRRCFYDRVMVSNLAHWEMSCPYVRDEAVFADALTDFIRGQQATVMHICCVEAPGQTSTLQRTILDDTNLLIDLSRVEHEGSDRVLMHVVKTRSMEHGRETVELGLDGVDLKVNISLLRLGRDGASHELGADLFLYSDSPLQREYYQDVRNRLRVTLGIKSKLHCEYNRKAVISALQMGPFVAGKSLRILQLDEFEVPQLREETLAGRSVLHPFLHTDVCPTDCEDVESALREHALAKDSQNRVIAVPYVQNIGILCVRNSDTLHDEDMTSWETIAEQCARWPGPEQYFWMPSARGEDLNCLFWEIALSLSAEEASSDAPQMLPALYGDAGKSLAGEGASGEHKLSLFPGARERNRGEDWHASVERWFVSNRAQKACHIFRMLCQGICQRGSTQRSNEYRHEESSVPKTNGRRERTASEHADAMPGQVRRLWFVCVREMDRDGGRTAYANSHFLPLPRKASVTGEFYLALAAGSAAIPVGLGVLRDLTSPSAEADRLRRGIGLPTRKRFYTELVTPDEGGLEGVDVGELLRHSHQNKYRRSRIQDYAKFAPILSEHLLKLAQLGTQKSPITSEALNSWRKQFLRAVRNSLSKTE